MNNSLIIIATYNEKGNIESLIDKIFTIVSDTHILIIDDNSPDKTYQLIEELIDKKYSNRLFLIKRSGKLGLGSAYVTGFNWGLTNNYQVIMHMDADFSHKPEYIPQFFNEIKNHDLVIGSRYITGGGVKNWGIKRRLISRGGCLYSKIILGIKVNDLTGGFKCFRSDVLKTININNLISNGFVFQIETTYKTYLNKFKIKEIPIIFEDRVVGASKMSGNIFLEALWMVLKLKLKLKANA
jgi:dolichol-phosphate mannosyltransferase